MRGAGFGPYAELAGAIALCRFGSQSAAVAADSVATAAAVASGATVVVGADGQAAIGLVLGPGSGLELGLGVANPRAHSKP